MKAFRLPRVVLPAALLALMLAPAALAAAKNCPDSPAKEGYLTQAVAGMSPEAIADAFIDSYLLDKVDEPVRRFWTETREREGTLENLLQAWDGSASEKSAAAQQAKPLGAARLVRAAIIAYEQRRIADARQAATLLAGEWRDWRGEHMSRDQFIAALAAEADKRKREGKTAYEAVLQAAQVMLNRLDNMHGAAGRRPHPDDRDRMWRWDFEIRKGAAREEVAALEAFEHGDILWLMFLQARKTVLRCVALGGPPAGKPQPTQREAAAPRAPAPPPQTGSGPIGAIIAAMDDNDFLERPKDDVEAISLSAGPKIGYQFYYLSGGKQCNFVIVRQALQLQALFVDMGCDGTADARRQGDEFVRPSEQDAALYAQGLREFAPFAQAMQKFNEVKAQGTLNFLAMIPVQRDNAKRLQSIMRLVDKGGFAIRDDAKSTNTVVFHGSNGISLVLVAKYGGGYYTQCTFAKLENGEAAEQYIDDDCDGGVDWGGKGDKVKKVDFLPNAEVYKTVLVDFGRFIEQAAAVVQR